MKQSCLRNKKFRTEVVHSAQKIGVCRTAVLFGVSRLTVGKWLKKFQEAGETALDNQSRKAQKHPERISDEILKQILDAKIEHPEWSSLKIIRELKIKVTPATVLKKIRENIKKCNPNTEAIKIYFDTIPITIKNVRFYHYLLSAREENSGLMVIGFANENVALMQAIFADCVFRITGWHKTEHSKITIYTGNGRYTQPGRDRGAFIRLLQDKTGITSVQKKLSVTHTRDLNIITKTLETAENCNRAEILFNSSLAMAEINFPATENNHRLTFILPLETDSELKKNRANQTEESFSNADQDALTSDFLVILLKRVLEERRIFSNRLYYRILEIVADCNLQEPLAAKAFSLLAEEEMTAKNYTACHHVMKLFGSWQVQQTGGTEKSSCYLRLRAELDQAEGKADLALAGFIRALAASEQESDYTQKSQICGRIGNLQKKRGRNQEALLFFNRQAEIAAGFNIVSEKFSAYLNLGYYYASNGDMERARFNYQKACNLAELGKNSAYQAEALSRLGNVYLYRNDLAEAEKCFLPLIELGKNNKDLVLLGESYNKLAMLAVRRNDHDKALSNAQLYYNISEKRNNPAGMAVAQRIMGISYLYMEQYRKSLNCLKKDLQISRRINNREFIAVAIGNIGTLYLNSNQLEKAIFAFQTQQAIAQILKNLRLEFTALTNSGIASMRLSDYQAALEYFDEQMKLSKKSGEKLYLALAYQSRAQALAGLLNFAQAVAAIKNALKYFLEIKDESRTCEARVDLAVFKSQMNQKKIRMKTLTALKADAEKNNRADLLKRLIELQT